MTIFDEFHQALLNTIIRYKEGKGKRGKTLSPKRQHQILAFQTLLNEHRDKAQRSALLLREAVIEFVTTLEVSWTKNIFPVWYDSQFRSQIIHILSASQFSGHRLIAEELSENYAWQKRILENADYQKVAQLLRENDRLNQALGAKTEEVDELKNALRIKETTTQQAIATRNAMRIENVELTLKNKAFQQELAMLRRSRVTQKTHQTEAFPYTHRRHTN